MTVVKPVVSYRQTLEAALEELADLMAEREILDEKRETLHQRIVKLRGAVRGLAHLCDVHHVEDEHRSLFPNEWADTDVGLTDAIRKVLSSHEDAYLSPVFIRDRLPDVGFDIKTHKNILASIHTVLKRLQRQGEAVPVMREGRTVYKGVVKKSDEDVEVTFEDGDIPF